MHILKYTLLLFILGVPGLSQAETPRYMATAIEGTIVEFSKDKESIILRLHDDTLMKYKIQRFTSHNHKPTTFADANGYKIDYSTLAAVGYIQKVRLSLSGDVVTHLAVVRLQPE